MNTELRKKAKNDFEKDFYKLMNNAIFGRSKQKKYFSENFLAMEMKKIKIKMNIPVYIGFTILEVSKTVIWKFFYDYLKPKYESKI